MTKKWRVFSIKNVYYVFWLKNNKRYCRCAINRSRNAAFTLVFYSNSETGFMCILKNGQLKFIVYQCYTATLYILLKTHIETLIKTKIKTHILNLSYSFSMINVNCVQNHFMFSYSTASSTIQINANNWQWVTCYILVVFKIICKWVPKLVQNTFFLCERGL